MDPKLKKKESMIMEMKISKSMKKTLNLSSLTKRMLKMKTNNMLIHSLIRKQDLESCLTRISLGEKYLGMIPLSLMDLRHFL